MKLATALLALVAFFAGPSQASVVINAVETGGAVEFRYSGSLDISSLTFVGVDPRSRTLLGASSGVLVSIGSPVNYYESAAFPLFGSGLRERGSMTGQSFAIYDDNFIGIFQDYVSGTHFAGKAIFDGTFARLGLFQGRYSIRLPNAETITLNIAAVPVPAAGFMLASALGLLAFVRRRKSA